LVWFYYSATNAYDYHQWTIKKHLHEKIVIVNILNVI